MCWLDADLEQLLSAETKEFSDGEMTVALASVTTDKEVKLLVVLIFWTFTIIVKKLQILYSIDWSVGGVKYRPGYLQKW